MATTPTSPGQMPDIVDPSGTVRRRRLLLDALYTFEAAARNPTFAGAADELGVTASAVSHQIRRLENHLDVKLFDRSAARGKLTPAGKALAKPLNELFGRMHGLVEDICGESSTRLTVSVMNAFGSKWLAPRISKFCVQNPEISVRLISSDTLIDFNNDEADIGIRYGRGDYPGLQSEKLMGVDAFPVCSPALLGGHEAGSPQELLLNHVLLHDESATRAADLPNWRSWLAESDIEVPHSAGGLLFESPHFAIEAALAGQGVALGLSPLVADDLAAGRLIAPFDYRQASNFSFWLVYHPDRSHLKKIKLFRQWIFRQVQGG